MANLQSIHFGNTVPGAYYYVRTLVVQAKKGVAAIPFARTVCWANFKDSFIFLTLVALQTQVLPVCTQVTASPKRRNFLVQLVPSGQIASQHKVSTCIKIRHTEKLLSEIELVESNWRREQGVMMR